jgi:hypothetical protein
LERDAGRESVDAPDPRSFATAVCQWAAAAGDSQELGTEPEGGKRLSQPGPRRRGELAWAEDRDDAPLEALLFPPPPAIAADQRPVPDWAWVHRELRRTNVTLALLREEHRASAPEGFGYSWSCVTFIEVGRAG